MTLKAGEDPKLDPKASTMDQMMQLGAYSGLKNAEVTVFWDVKNQRPFRVDINGKSGEITGKAKDEYPALEIVISEKKGEITGTAKSFLVGADPSYHDDLRIYGSDRVVVNRRAKNPSRDKDLTTQYYLLSEEPLRLDRDYYLYASDMHKHYRRAR